MNNYKFKVGDKVRVRSDLNVGEYYGGLFFVEGCMRGIEAIISKVLKNGVIRLSTSNYLWTSEMLEPVSMTKEEWLIALIKGAVGVQSGSPSIRYYYKNGTFRIGDNTSVDINFVYSYSTFSLVQEVEMTIEEIEKKLGVTNLKIVK